jgi:hypothetical protein
LEQNVKNLGDKKTEKITAKMKKKVEKVRKKKKLIFSQERNLLALIAGLSEGIDQNGQ